MLDPVPAHVKLVEGYDILGEIVLDAIVCTELPFHRIFRGQQVCYLHIEFFSSFFAYKVNFFFSCSAYCDNITPSQQFHVDNVFEDQVDVLHVPAEHSLPNAVIRNIILFVGGQYLLALQVLALYLIEEICVTAVPHIVQDGFRRDSPLLIFEKLSQRGR